MIVVADQRYMQRCIKLAKKASGFVSPNPMVGCVIVKKGKIIAEGYHQKFGGPHAEINALSALAKKQKNKKTKKHLIGTTVYVNLEPCAHYGKTPPCVDALIAAGVKRVVVGMTDPNPLVAGKSIRQLRRAGIEVEAEVLKEECAALNESFSKWITTGRPFVLLKVALTLDGALTFKKGTRSDFSSPATLNRTHELRQEYDAIAVGVNTVLIDDPLLTTRGRMTRARNPVRLVFDTHLRLPEHARLLRSAGRTIIFTGPKVNEKKKKKILKSTPSFARAARDHSPSCEGEISGCPPLMRGGVSRLSRDGVVDIIPISLDRSGHISLKAALKWLGEHNISSVMVEGGAEVASSLLRQKLADKIILIITPHLASDPAAPRLFPVLSSLPPVWPRGELVGRDAWLTANL